MLRKQGNRARAASFGLEALVLTVAVSSTACQRDTTASAQTTRPKRADMRTVTVPVNGMICMVCAGSVKNALKAVHGVQKAEVNLEKHNVTVQYENGKVSVDELTRAINQLGYKAGVPAPAQSQ
jgi:copper chaperone